MERFLTARTNHLPKALAMSKAALECRSSFKPASLTTKDFERAHSQGVWRLAGRTKAGCGVLLASVANWKSISYSVDEYLKMVAYHLEASQSRNPGGKSFVILDMKRMGYFSDMRKIRGLARIFNDYYPERLGRAVFIHCDWVFDKLFRFGIQWVDKRTKEKCIDFRDNGAECLLQFIDADAADNRSGWHQGRRMPSGTNPIDSRTTQRLHRAVVLYVQPKS